MQRYEYGGRLRMTDNNIEKIIEMRERVAALVSPLLGKELDCVPSITKDADEWKVVVEVVERRAVPDGQDIIGKYEFRLSDDGILDYRRLSLRRRIDVGQEVATDTEDEF